MIATRIGKQEHYVCAVDRFLPEDQRTTFVIQVLTARARMKVVDKMVGMDEDEATELAEPGTGLLAACRFGIVRVEGLRNDSGAEVAVERRRLGNHMILTDAGLDLIADAIPEVGARILQLNRLDEDLAGDADDPTPAGNASTSSETLPQGEHSTTTESSEETEPAQPVTVSP